MRKWGAWKSFGVDSGDGYNSIMNVIDATGYLKMVKVKNSMLYVFYNNILKKELSGFAQMVVSWQSLCLHPEPEWEDGLRQLLG